MRQALLGGEDFKTTLPPSHKLATFGPYPKVTRACLEEAKNRAVWQPVRLSKHLEADPDARAPVLASATFRGSGPAE